jgi:hypothetical protein
MTEDRLARGVVDVEGVTCTLTSVEDIPSDDNSLMTMDVNQVPTGDIGIWAHDRSGRRFISPIRLNSFAGGGPYTFVHAELVEGIIRTFAKTKGQIPADFPKLRLSPSDRLPSYVSTRVERGNSTDSFELKVANIESMDNVPEDEDGLSSQNFLDIEVAKDGNITVTIRNVRYGEKDRPARLVFKTAENGGKFPLVAEVFTRVAESLEAAAPRRR